MKVVILDDTRDASLNSQQQWRLMRWYKRLEDIFPCGEVQIFDLRTQKEELRKALGL